MERVTDAAPDGFAGLLRGLRRQAGLTQATLSERAGVGTRTVQDLERGLHHPRGKVLQQLTLALELTGERRTQFEAAARPVPLRQHAHVLPVRRSVVPPRLTDMLRHRATCPRR